MSESLAAGTDNFFRISVPRPEKFDKNWTKQPHRNIRMISSNQKDKKLVLSKPIEFRLA